jgi:methylase of polypeptide subunit release factors
MGASASTRITVAFDACSRATDVAAANAAATGAACTHARRCLSVCAVRAIEACM